MFTLKQPFFVNAFICVIISVWFYISISAFYASIDEGKDFKTNYSCVSESMESSEDIALQIKELQKLKRRRRKEEEEKKREEEEKKRKKQEEGNLYMPCLLKS